MQFRRQAANDESINLTPLIDVVFLLLIFFMVSTTFTEETHLSIDLPEASVEPVASETSQGIDVVIQSNGDYLVNGKPLTNQKEKTLLRALEITAAGDTSQALTITADASASHQSVVRAMDVAGQVGFSQLRITTREPSEG